MTTAEKITAIEGSGLSLAWDTCHKIYVLDTKGEEDEAAEGGFEILDASDIRRVILDSCGLVFVSAWSLDDRDWTIPQCTEDIYTAAEAAA